MQMKINPITGKMELDRADRDLIVTVVDGWSDLTVGDDLFRIPVPPLLDGAKIMGVKCWVQTASTSGIPTIQAYNQGTGGDVLSTRCTIDANEYYSGDAAASEVVNSSHETLTAGKYLRFDCDVAGTGTKGLTCIIQARLP